MSKATKADTPQKVNYNDAVAESKKYFDGDDLAATVWVSKYALKDSFGNIYEKSPRWSSGESNHVMSSLL